MNQLRGLLLDHFDDFGMTMTRRADGDAGVGIEKDVAVHVFDPHARAAFGDEFICGARVRWINELVIGGDDLLPTRAGQSGFDLRPFKRRDGAGSHNTSPYDETETDQVEISNLKSQSREQRGEKARLPREDVRADVEGANAIGKGFGHHVTQQFRSALNYYAGALLVR